MLSIGERRVRVPTEAPQRMDRTSLFGECKRDAPLASTARVGASPCVRPRPRHRRFGRSDHHLLERAYRPGSTGPRMCASTHGARPSPSTPHSIRWRKQRPVESALDVVLARPDHTFTARRAAFRHVDRTEADRRVKVQARGVQLGGRTPPRPGERSLEWRTCYREGRPAKFLRRPTPAPARLENWVGRSRLLAALTLIAR